MACWASLALPLFDVVIKRNISDQHMDARRWKQHGQHEDWVGGDLVIDLLNEGVVERF